MVTQYELGSARNFVYLLEDPATRECAIVDPWKDLDPVEASIRERGLRLTHILLTHTHWDHVGGIASLTQKNPDLRVFVHAADQRGIAGKCPPERIQNIQDNQILRIGSLEVEVLHTPGHSPGECCYRFAADGRSYVITGDTLFIEDCGRTDLPGGSDEEMLRSLHRLRSLPPETVVLPGHHYKPASQSTMGQELTRNPALRCETLADLRALP